MDKVKKLCKVMQKHDLKNIIICDPFSIKYFTNYITDPGERLLVLLVKANEQACLFLNELFPPFQSKEIDIIYYQDGEDIISKIADKLDYGKTSIDKIWPSQFLLELMSKKSQFSPVNFTKIIDDMRGIKSDAELDIMREASQLNDLAMEALLREIQADQSEIILANKLKEIYRKLGHNDVSFPPIIAYGKHGADPHHINTDQLPKKGDPIIIDIGGSYRGYASDMTRTVFWGQVSETVLNIYDIVRQANEAAIAIIKPGIPLREIDLTARNIIEKAGYGKYFTHRLGHFIGQTAHEAGDVSQYNYDLAKVGQVFSIEPGIYLPNQFGIRIEDLVVVTEDGCEVLNHFTKEPIILPINN